MHAKNTRLHADISFLLRFWVNTFKHKWRELRRQLTYDVQCKIELFSLED
jgi:hypothetical protein